MSQSSPTLSIYTIELVDYRTRVKRRQGAAQIRQRSCAWCGTLQGEHGRSEALAGLGGSRELQHVGKTGRIENRGGLIPDYLH